MSVANAAHKPHWSSLAAGQAHPAFGFRERGTTDFDHGLVPIINYLS